MHDLRTLANFRFRFSFLILLLTALSCSSVYGQRTLGITWEIPENQQEAISQLEKFHKLGISIIEIQRSPNAAVWRHIDSLGFDVYGSLGVRFPTSSTFEQPDSSLIESIRENASGYLSQPSVTAIGLFEHGSVGSSSFWESLIPIATQLKTERPLPFYFTSHRIAKITALPNYFTILDIPVSASKTNPLVVPQDTLIGGYRYAPTDKLTSYVTPFKKFLEATAAAPQKPVFISSNWLYSIQKKYPQFTRTVQAVTSEENTVFPLPNETLPASQSSPLPVIILLIVWGTIAFHYHSSPLYRKSLFRYFTAHKFFINDIFQRQIRSPLPAVIIILQHTLLLASAVFVTAISVFSPLGQEAFFYHLPQLAIIGSTPYSIWGLALLGTVIVSFFCTLWLYLGHKSIHSFTQIATIYAWPLQVNFVLTTTAITLYSSGASSVFIVLLSSLAVLIFLLTFFFAALDATRFSRSKLTFQLKTTIPYVVIVAGLSAAILLQEKWLEAVSLALNLK